MKILVDPKTLTGEYDERNLDQCVCGCGLKIVTKKMFVDFLEQNYADINAQAIITSVQDYATGEVVINITVQQKLVPQEE